MRISAKADYAVRAAVELAAAPGEKPVKAERIATAQEIPLNFLENILGELRHAGIVRSHRGAEGGFRLAKARRRRSRSPTSSARSRGRSPASAAARPRRPPTPAPSAALPRVWIAVRANLRKVVEHVTVADVASGELPAEIDRLAEDPEAWVTR